MYKPVRVLFGSVVNHFEVDIPVTCLPDGAYHCDVSKLPKTVEYFFEVSIHSFNDLGKLLCIADALYRRYGFRPAELYIKYIPLRQDREQPGFPFTVDLYGKILSIVGCKNLALIHPHGNSRQALADSLNQKVWQYFPYAQFGTAKGLFGPDTFIIPDKGAANLVDIFGINRPVVFCEKTRDPSTGKLSNPKVNGNPKGRCLIVDDICDGGGTFIQLAQELKKFPEVTELGLFVTHGIFSKGYKELNKYFSEIYTTKSYWENPAYCLEVADDCRVISL